jgi:Holliday junction DNA helicase RuvA
MISSLRGILASKKIESITVDVNGVGYEVFVPLKTFSKLPEEGNSIFLFIQTIVKEDDISLYGFSSVQEREVFRILRLAKGVGSKTAFALLSSFDAEDIMGYIISEDAASISLVPGIGRKTAERIIFELRDRVKKYIEKAPLASGPRIELDVELALISLGYSLKDAKDAIKKSGSQLGGDFTIEEMVKTALKHLARR